MSSAKLYACTLVFEPFLGRVYCHPSARNATRLLQWRKTPRFETRFSLQSIKTAINLSSREAIRRSQNDCIVLQRFGPAPSFSPASTQLQLKNVFYLFSACAATSIIYFLHSSCYSAVPLALTLKTHLISPSTPKGQQSVIRTHSRHVMKVSKLTALHLRYAAGIGAGNELAWACSRYDGSYGNLVAIQLGVEPEKLDFTYTACSGALVPDVHKQATKLSPGQEFVLVSAVGDFFRDLLSFH